MALERELTTFKNKLLELSAADEGKFVLIRGDDVIGVFTSYEDAIKSGYEKFQLEPFLVKQIRVIEKVQFVSRLVSPHPAPLAG